MNRRTFLETLASSVLLTTSLATDAQPAGKVYRIGVLERGGSSPTANPINEAFRQQLRELGYIEGHNIVLEYRLAEGKAERLPDFAAELVRLKVDVIVAAKAIGLTIPQSLLLRADQIIE